MYKRDGGVRRIFLGLKFSTPVFFWVEDLTVYFFGSEKSARIFLGSNFRQANSSYAIQAKVPAISESMNRIISSLVFFWVHNIRSMYFFGCKILGSVGPPATFIPEYPPWAQPPESSPWYVKYTRQTDFFIFFIFFLHFLFFYARNF